MVTEDQVRKRYCGRDGELCLADDIISKTVL